MSEATATAPAPMKLVLERSARHELPTAVLDIALESESEFAYAACFDGVYRLNLASGAAERLYAHNSYASGVVRLPDRPVLISAGFDGWLIWYDLERRSVFRRVRAHRFWSWKMTLAPDGRYVASVSGQYLAGGEKYEPAQEEEPSVKLYDTFTGELLQAFSHVPPVQAVAISADSQFVAAGNLMGEVRVWHAATGELAAHWTTDALTSWGIIKSHCYIGGINAMHFSRAGDAVYVAGMGPMRDPMAGNGRQLWQQFAWREIPVRRVDETHAGESGEGLMETLAFHPEWPVFLMGGRLRGGEWNAAFFSTLDGAKLHHINSGFRMTSSRFSTGGDQLVVAGTKNQPPPENGAYPAFGRVECYRVARDVG